MAKLRITFTKSSNGSTKGIKNTLRCLGLRRLNQTVEVEKNPIVMGQLRTVSHLVKIEELD